jgi:hypothetical protein
MTEPTDNHMPELESSLLELRQAENAGVFRPTRVDARQLMRSGPPRRLAIRWAAAAALLLAVGTVWTTMFYMNLTKLRDGRGGGALASVSITDCLAGPRGSQPGHCLAYDLDADGDVDLADLGSFQLAYAEH